MIQHSADVVVIGAGLAGLSAALEARNAGASVLILERAPVDERGRVERVGDDPPNIA